MKPVNERTSVIARCLSGHQWQSEILPGSTMPQTSECPECGMTLSSVDSLQLIIPAGVGYYQEFAGNITGDFHRATEPITVTYERDHGSQVIFRLPNGKRGITRKDVLMCG